MRLIQNPSFNSVGSVSALSPLAREFERLFSLGNALADTARKNDSWPLPLDIEENSGSIIVRADLPGVDRSAIKISLEDGLLSIAAERREENEKSEQTSHYHERRFGSFTRTVQLPVEVQSDKVKAVLKDGVLTVTLSKAEAAKPKQIEVGVE